jgi:hypothetical protein
LNKTAGRVKVCNTACMPAYGRKTACKLFCKAGGQGCRARPPGKAAGQGCRASLPGKSAGQVCNVFNCEESLNKTAGRVNNAILHACRPTAVKQLANFSARLAGKVAWQGCRASLPGKAAGQGCRARLPGKAAGQGCRAKVHAMVQYAESMVKLDNNAVF